MRKLGYLDVCWNGAFGADSVFVFFLLARMGFIAVARLWFYFWTACMVNFEFIWRLHQCLFPEKDEEQKTR